MTPTIEIHGTKLSDERATPEEYAGVTFGKTPTWEYVLFLPVSVPCVVLGYLAGWVYIGLRAGWAIARRP